MRPIHSLAIENFGIVRNHGQALNLTEIELSKRVHILTIPGPVNPPHVTARIAGIMAFIARAVKLASAIFGLARAGHFNEVFHYFLSSIVRSFIASYKIIITQHLD
jgi:hypothetical protein